MSVLLTNTFKVKDLIETLKKFDENLDDKERSAKVYDFLIKYPDHPLSEQAKNLLLMASDTLSELEQVHKWKENEENSSKN